MVKGKAITGIQGFDEITEGGLPRGRTSLLLGGPGTGKTIFALQTLVNGIRHHGEPGIFVTFEEKARHIVANMANFGWNLPALEKKKLLFLNARISPDMVHGGQFDLVGLLAALTAKARQMGARRVAFDSIDVLLTLMGNVAAEHQEMYRIHDWLGTHDMTGLITARTEGGDPLMSPRYSFMQFMADCVVFLQHDVQDRISSRDLRVIKYRGSNFAENQAPLAIGPAGIEVGSAGTPDGRQTVYTERVSTGVERLDTMLRGGYYRGSSALITGAPGTAKSTLCGTFAQAACQRGERTLYISFDEAAPEIIRNLSSVGLDLGRAVRRGLLQMHSAFSEARSAEEHLLRIRKMIDQHQPRCLVVDPLSALIKSGGELAAQGIVQRLLRLAKSRGITVVCTSLLEGPDAESEATQLAISTIADTWIHLSYVAKGGERNRALTIVKSRGTKHSNQVRELILTDHGLTLTDVYTAGGEVLMGTLRWEKEAAARLEKERLGAEMDLRRQELELAESEVNARIDTLKRELATRRRELTVLMGEQALREQQGADRQREVQRIRGADAGGNSKKARPAKSNGDGRTGRERPSSRRSPQGGGK